MSDLISRKAVIDKAITIPIAKIVTEDKVIYRRIVFVEDIEKLPSVQPEIIRCRDCKHYIRSNATNLTVCNKHDGLPYTVDGTDFCSRAEWKEDENYKQN